MQLPATKLQAMIKKAVTSHLLKEEKKESLAQDLLPGADGKLSAYLTKVETFIDTAVEDAEKLAVEGEELMRADFTRNTSVGERNRLFLLSIGMLRKLRFGMASLMLDLRKAFG